MNTPDENDLNETALKISLMTETVLINSASLMDQQFNLKELLTKIELRFINEALEKSNGIVAHAAEKLGLRRTTLVEKMKRYQILK